MSDTPQGPGWWMADDGKWYPPERRVGDSTAPPSPEAVAAPPASAVANDSPKGPGWWMADDGKWYPPERRVGDSTAPPSPEAQEPVVAPLAPVGPPTGGRRPAGLIALVAVVVISVLLGLSAALVLLAGDDADETITGVAVTGNGWTATFPGEVERSTESFLVDGYTAFSEDITWESPDEQLAVWTTDYPPEWIEMIESTERTTLLEYLMEEEEVRISDSPVLDADATFRGREAVVLQENSPEGIGVALLVLEGARFYEVFHSSSDGDTTSWEALIDSFEFTD